MLRKALGTVVPTRSLFRTQGMTMTEDEAKKKLCPLMRYCVNARDAICHKEPAVYEQSTCQASDCMAWAWHGQEYEDGTPLPMGSNPADPGWEMDGTVWCAGGEYGTGERRQRWRRPLPRTGYCSMVSSKE